ncbi:DUF3558 family protein [Amycolatopsis viridis]|uniref:DUF3558 domain-containing protein n=1 Tax=Amycolatopsis viridis TaxID=185678 RepID=A0ABX0T1K0_9PSEU|nr:DUF3558 family protein [Amycolatopsis viridis]NIH83097.1 hypothetical protein [Amycolatopsis viridis]
MRWRIAVAVAAAGLVSACTTAVSGTPQPAPGRVTVTPAPSTDPCTLLTIDEAASLGLGAGTSIPVDPKLGLPASCDWLPPGPDGNRDDSLQAYFHTGQSIEEYFAMEPAGEEHLGGITWQRYSYSMGYWMCELAAKFGEHEFVVIASRNWSDESKACVVADRAAPSVAGHLPHR